MSKSISFILNLQISLEKNQEKFLCFAVSQASLRCKKLKLSNYKLTFNTFSYSMFNWMDFYQLYHTYDAF
ncbi:hypothetical protein DLM75_08705 [Leptospira stimsonii]|uniref:Uncharacterized protein n=1 Tax=Leptospira stimsonii TaxID=2202203 RepID=A0A396Z9Y7_9LEPT|nr:hypothetical protein DLM75_08705 [Leptospira stimsonii]